MLCHTGTTVHMGMAYGHLIIHPSVIIHLMEGPFLGLSSGQAAVASHGVEVVAGYSVAAEGSVVVGDNAWGPHGGTLSASLLKRKGGDTEILHSPCSFRMTLGKPMSSF